MAGKQIAGILNILKPAGPTSHDVVAVIRRLFRQKRVGHAGTLDPAAHGVLLVGIGKATRVLEYLQELPKTYRARITLGITTDTHDATGTIRNRAPWDHVRWGTIKEALGAFQGDIMQMPPMYAALKRNGRPLYALARQGITVEREQRPVRIHGLKVLGWQPPLLELEIVCSRGTYIRAVARDLGAALHTGACLTSLTRTAIGEHDLQGATSLGALETLERSFAETRVMDMATALAHLPAARVSSDQLISLQHGQALALDVVPPSEPALALDEHGHLAAILVRHGPSSWRPAKVLMPAANV